MIETIGGRKVLICAVALIVCVGVVLLKGDVPSGLQSMLQFIVGTYIAGNVGADLVTARKAESEAKVAAAEAAPVAPAPETSVATSGEIMAIANQLDMLQSSVSELAQAEVVTQNGVAAILQIAQGRPRAG